MIDYRSRPISQICIAAAANRLQFRGRRSSLPHWFELLKFVKCFMSAILCWASLFRIWQIANGSDAQLVLNSHVVEGLWTPARSSASEAQILVSQLLQFLLQCRAHLGQARQISYWLFTESNNWLQFWIIYQYISSFDHLQTPSCQIYLARPSSLETCPLWSHNWKKHSKY